MYKRQGYEGFYYLESFKGNTDNAVLSYILRDHDACKLESKKSTLKLIEKLLNEKYGEGTVKLTITDQYKNMAEHIKPCMHLIDNAKSAMEILNVKPVIEPIRGGTDGATLSYMGLPLSLIHICFYEVFNELQEKDIIFAAASGRQYYNLLERFKGIEERMMFIAENGTFVVYKGKELIVKMCIRDRLDREYLL